MKKNLFYYQFRLITSGQSDHSKIAVYEHKPTHEDLKNDLEHWCQLYGCWSICERATYSAMPVNTPKNRSACLKIYNRACKAKRLANEKWKLYVDLLQVTPFNGTK